MSTINNVFPRPRQVVLGGREFLVSEFTHGDIADINAWLRNQSPNKNLLSQLRGELEGFSEADKALIIRVTLQEMKRPMTIETREGMEYVFNTVEGLMFLFGKFLNVHQKISDEELEELLPKVTEDERAEFMSAYKGLDPHEELEEMLVQKRMQGGSASWEEVFKSLAQSGWKPEDMERLTRKQLIALAEKAPESSRADVLREAKEREQLRN